MYLKVRTHTHTCACAQARAHTQNKEKEAINLRECKWNTWEVLKGEREKKE